MHSVEYEEIESQAWTELSVMVGFIMHVVDDSLQLAVFISRYSMENGVAISRVWCRIY